MVDNNLKYKGTCGQEKNYTSVFLEEVFSIVVRNFYLKFFI